MNRLNLRNNRLKFKTPGKLPANLEESMEYTSNYKEKPKDHNILAVGLWKLDWGFDRLCSKISPDTGVNLDLLANLQT